jgi:hypothetical protein
MKKPAYFLANFLASAAAITTSTEDDLFVKANLYDQIAGKPFKFTSSTTGYIEIDHGAAATYDTIAIIGHNLTAESSVVVKGGAAANPSTVIETAEYREDCLWIDLGSRNERYTRVVFTDTNPDKITIGEIVLGTRIELPRAPRFGVQASREEMDLAFETVRRVESVYKLGGRERRKYAFRFPQSEYDDFRDMHMAVGGQAAPFVWIPDQDGAEVFYVRKQAGFDPRASEEPAQDSDGLDEIYDYDLELREEVHGVLVLS